MRSREEILNLDIDYLELATREVNILKKAGVKMIREVTELSEKDLLRQRGCGPVSISWIKRSLNDLGLCMKP